MKISTNVVLALAFLTSSVSATAPSVTVQLANDQSGANADVNIQADGVQHSVEELWGKTAVARNGAVYASSTQLTSFQQDTVCKIFGPGVDVTLTAIHTWSWLEGGKVVNLANAFIVCKDT